MDAREQSTQTGAESAEFATEPSGSEEFATGPSESAEPTTESPERGSTPAEGSIPWGTQWQLVRAADPALPGPTTVTLAFQEGRAVGKAPVNRYFGTCVEGEDGSLAFGPFGMTMMAGPEPAMAAERAYTQLLERVATVAQSGGELVLLDDQGSQLLAYSPAVDA